MQARLRHLQELARLDVEPKRSPPARQPLGLRSNRDLSVLGQEHRISVHTFEPISSPTTYVAAIATAPNVNWRADAHQTGLPVKRAAAPPATIRPTPPHISPGASDS